MVFEVAFFFFQAEDGIRDTSVTGVQTCALPILPVEVQPEGAESQDLFDEHRHDRPLVGGKGPGNASYQDYFILLSRLPAGVGEIGRASCRERRSLRGCAGALEKYKVTRGRGRVR